MPKFVSFYTEKKNAGISLRSGHWSYIMARHVENEREREQCPNLQ